MECAIWSTLHGEKRLWMKRYLSEFCFRKSKLIHEYQSKAFLEHLLKILACALDDYTKKTRSSTISRLLKNAVEPCLDIIQREILKMQAMSFIKLA